MSQSPLLYQNADETVTLIDIPTSIAQSQATDGQVLSTPARQEPFPSMEPQSRKARNQVLARIKNQHNDDDVVRAMDAALAEIRGCRSEPWNCRRWCLDERSAEQEQQAAIEERMNAIFREFTKSGSKILSFQISAASSSGSQILHDWDGSHFNESHEPIQLHIAPKLEHLDASESRNAPREEPLVFHIPPHASFLLSDCNAPNKFRNHIRWMGQEYGKSRKFDFILLDPPWENRSAKRRAAYETSSVQAMITEMDLGSYLQDEGLVGIWVTNKAAHRDLILGSGGIFESLNVTLIEEWIWIKTTSRGEPVTQLDGIWRKPYEMLLLGQAPPSRLQVAPPVGHVTRRILAGVPDFHSRKPCLKILIEARLPVGYQALEVFARYLVQGWTSWGNEVLKYNWKGYHKSAESIVHEAT